MPIPPAKQTPAVDVVYTWVDGGDPDYRALYGQYAQTPADTNPERYRDLYSMIKYSLRSLALYAPWVRDVYLLTCRPQVPDWLDTDRADVHVVHHDEIFDKACLPTFNCNVIESFLHRLPNPSDYLLYLNDDFLFGRETALADWLDDEGRLRVMGTLMGERLKFRIYERKNDIVSFGRIEHTPILVYKPFWKGMLESQPEKVARTRGNRFRQDDDLRMDKLYRYYLLAEQADSARAVGARQLLRYHRFHKITNRYGRQRRGLGRIEATRPKFYCLNDDQRDRPNLEVVRLVREFLDRLYPEKSPYEK